MKELAIGVEHDLDDGRVVEGDAELMRRARHQGLRTRRGGRRSWVMDCRGCSPLAGRSVNSLLALTVARPVSGQQATTAFRIADRFWAGQSTPSANHGLLRSVRSGPSRDQLAVAIGHRPFDYSGLNESRSRCAALAPPAASSSSSDRGIDAEAQTLDHGGVMARNGPCPLNSGKSTDKSVGPSLAGDGQHQLRFSRIDDKERSAGRIESSSPIANFFTSQFRQTMEDPRARN